MLNINEFAEDNFNNVYYSALVIDNNSPDKDGAVQIRIDAIHNEVKNSELPWALPTSGVNVNDIPLLGAYVWVTFQQGNVYEPIYSGSVLSRKNLPNVFAEDYPNTRGIYDGVNWITLNSKTGKLVIHSKHQEISLNDNELKVNSSVTMNITVNGDVNVNATKVNLNCNTTCTNTVKANMLVDDNGLNSTITVSNGQHVVVRKGIIASWA